MAGIFKAYDIRGIVGKDLTPGRAFWIGRALASEVFGGQSPIVVTRDMRTHSPELSDKLIEGLCAGGCDVVDVGLAATPMNYWANVRYGAAGSVQVTASHNSAPYNGFKVSGQRATPRDFLTGLDKVEAFVQHAEDVEAPSDARPGTVSQPVGALAEYLEYMAPFMAPGTRRVKIAVDAANGMACQFMPGFAEKFPWLEVVPLYWELDGTFPNHEADPLKPENLVDLQKLTVEAGCDFGVSFDGDADRCMFVDETGAAISSDLVTALIAPRMIAQQPGAAILFDLRSSQVVAETIAAHGGEPVRGRVGHSFMKRLLVEKNAPFGGELSGHYYFAACNNTDSGLMAMIQMLNLWRDAQEGGPATLSSLVAPLRKYCPSGEINFRVDDTKVVLEKIEAHYAAQGAWMDHLDGLTVKPGDWWFNLRSSNTEPLLRLNLEAATPSALTEHLAQVQTLIGGEVAGGH